MKDENFHIMKIAVLITVFNRREITLLGLKSLMKSIGKMSHDFVFDIYMTDDGCTDGTADAVKKEFPSVIIINGDGNLYWGGGMRYAWQTAAESGIEYDYYLWYNDDSNLYEEALLTIFEYASENRIITGAFCSSQGAATYGGRDADNQILIPNGFPQEVVMMNGNLVLVPEKIFQAVGNISSHLKHGGGDFDYGFRARKAGFKIFLTNGYVGIADRHDEYIPKYCSTELRFIKRWKMLHSPVYSPMEHFKYNFKYNGIMSAVKSFVVSYIGVICPMVYKRMKDSLVR